MRGKMSLTIEAFSIGSLTLFSRDIRMQRFVLEFFFQTRNKRKKLFL